MLNRCKLADVGSPRELAVPSSVFDEGRLFKDLTPLTRQDRVTRAQVIRGVTGMIHTVRVRCRDLVALRPGTRQVARRDNIR